MFSALQRKDTQRCKEEPDVGIGKQLFLRQYSEEATDWTLKGSWLYFRQKNERCAECAV